MHYDPRSKRGRVYFTLERLLGTMTDAFIFVSQYEADAYAAKVGRPKNATVALNGLRAEEFAPVTPAPDARDFLFIGMMREAKGPQDFISAMALMRDRTGRAPTRLDGRLRRRAPRLRDAGGAPRPRRRDFASAIPCRRARPSSWRKSWSRRR